MSQSKDLAADLPKSGGRKEVDWDGMEKDWRAGIKPVLQLSKEFGVSRAAINKHWDKEGIERDLTARIEARAQALVTQAQVTQEVAQEQRVTEKAIVEANAQMQANIMLAHRKDVPRVRGLLTKLLEELESSVDAREDLEHIGEILNGGDESKMADLFRKLNSLPGRIDSGKKLAEALKVAVSLERDVFGIVGTPTSETPIVNVAVGMDFDFDAVRKQRAKVEKM